MVCVEDATEPSIRRPIPSASKQFPSELVVFCDLDGPLIDVSRRYYKTYQLAIAETQAYYQAQAQPLRLAPLDASQFWQMKQERIPDADIAFCSGLRHEQIELFLSFVHDIVNKPLLLQEDRIQAGIYQALLKLRQCGAYLAVVTLRYQAEALQILQQYGLADLFERIQGTQDYGAAYYNYTACKQQLLEDLITQEALSTSGQCWMIGDTEADILAGQALGLSTMALTCGMRSHSYLEQLQPTCVQRDLRMATQYLLTCV